MAEQSTRQPIQIESDSMYPREWVVDTFGRRWLQRLTAAGLKAHSGWYRGKEILDADDRAEQRIRRQCASEETEEKPDERQQQVKKVEAYLRPIRVDHVPVPNRTEPLRSQAARLRGIPETPSPSRGSRRSDR